MRIWVIDAFADRPFSGNPAAVCLLDGDAWPPEDWMRRTAIEMNLPMTAFARRLSGDAGAEWGLRWFNAVVEERLCGHATLATAHALHSAGEIDGSVRFRTLAGVLAAHADDELITLDFPAAPLSVIRVAPELSAALGAAPDDAYEAPTLRDLVAVFDDEATVRSLEPDMAALAELTAADALRGVTVTAAATDPTAGYDFVSRFFSPAHGLPEDPVTGSAHTALAPYWSARFGREGLTGLQASARTGVVETEINGDRVLLAGRAVTVIDGTMHATPEHALT